MAMSNDEEALGIRTAEAIGALQAAGERELGRFGSGFYHSCLNALKKKVHQPGTYDLNFSALKG
jgi:hypothetical protein